MEVDVPMSRYTTLRIGGIADIIAYPHDTKDLREVVVFAKENNLPCLLLGLGSNLLVTDAGIRGVVVCLRRSFKGIEMVGEYRISCGAGVPLAAAAAFAAEKELSGLEGLAGIPGTVGGALAMNAGAFGMEIKDIVEEVVLMDEKGDILTAKRDELKFSYRNLGLNTGDIILKAVFLLEPGSKGEIRESMKEKSAVRGVTQPLGCATAGSVFKNPPGDFAGRLIEAAGFKGVSVGNAKVSEKHANFIENTGGATSAEILALMERMREGVFQKFGIRLKPEIKVIGEQGKVLN